MELELVCDPGKSMQSASELRVDRKQTKFFAIVYTRADLGVCSETTLIF